MDAKIIGQRLVTLRGKQSQETVANNVGISVSALSMYEQGNRIPRDEVKIRLAQYFNCTVQELFYAS